MPGAMDSSAASERTTTAESEAPPPPSSEPTVAPSQQTNWRRRFAQIASTVVVIAILRAVFSGNDGSRSRSVGGQASYTEPAPAYQTQPPPKVAAPPKVRQHLTFAQISAVYQEALKKRPYSDMTLQEFSRYEQEQLPDYDFSEGINYLPSTETPALRSESGIVTAPPQREPPTEKPTPIQQQATPASSSISSTVAGSGTVENNNAVLRTPNILSQKAEHRDFFTVGSTKEEVLALQGTPTAFTPSRFDYGYSYVDFVRDHVVAWSQSPANPLKAKLLPSRPVESRDYLNAGASREWAGRQSRNSCWHFWRYSRLRALTARSRSGWGRDVSSRCRSSHHTERDGNRSDQLTPCLNTASQRQSARR